MASWLYRYMDAVLKKFREKNKEIEGLRIERDYWKTTLIAELEENESGDGVDNEMHEHEKALQQALKEG